MRYRGYSTTSKETSSNGMLYDLKIVNEDVLNIIMTRKGEYPMMTNKGCIIHDYMFNPTVTEREIIEIQNDMIEQVSADPRLSNVQVFVQQLSEGQGLIVAIYADISGLDDALAITETFRLEN